MALSPNELESGCWTSQTTLHDGPGHSMSGHDLVVSVILDGGSSRLFSGIRIVFYCSARTDFANISLKDAHSFDVDTDSSSSSASPDQAETSIVAHQWGQDRPSLTSNPHLPLCPIFLEITDASTDIWSQVSLVPHLTLPPAESEFRILYTHLHQAPIATLSLQCTHSFRGQLKRGNPAGMACAYPAGTGPRTDTIRVLPPAPVRLSFARPPPAVLRRVFWHAAADRKRGWRAGLVEFSCVCRAWWAPACSVVFEDMQSWARRPDAQVVARAVERDPAFGRAVRRFGDAYFYDGAEDGDEGGYLQRARAVVGILQCATEVRELDMSCTHEGLGREYVHALCRSAEVRSFAIHQGPADVPGRYRLSIGDIQTCVDCWPRLEKLTVNGFSASDDNAADSDVHPASGSRGSPSLQHRAMTELALTHGTITAHQLVALAARAPLTRIHLDHLSGLSNAGLRALLTCTGATVEHLHVKYTPLTRESGEPHALDASMCVMPHLRRLEAAGDVVSALVLRDEGQRFGGRRLTIRDAPGLSAAEVVSALGETGWSVVELPGVFGRRDKRLRDAAILVAKEKLIQLSC